MIEILENFAGIDFCEWLENYDILGELSQMTEKFTRSRKSLPTKLSTNKVIENLPTYLLVLYLTLQKYKMEPPYIRHNWFSEKMSSREKCPL